MTNYIQFTRKFLVTNKQILIIATVILLLALLVSNRLATPANDERVTDTEASVTTTKIASLIPNNELRLLGTVAPAEEAYVTSETSGRIVNIYLEEGDQVRAGTVLASLNNTEQRISVTQAEATLQAARAAAAQSDIGVEEAQTRYNQAREVLENSLQSSFSTVQRILQENIDPHYSNPRSGAIGVRVGKGVMVQTLNEKRLNLRNIMISWETKTLNLTSLSEAELLQLVIETQQNIDESISLIDDFIYVFQNEDVNYVYTDETLQNLYITFTRRKEELLTLQNTLSTNRTNLANAKNAVDRAEISSTSGTYAGGSTQVKQAEASLASARNRLSQTIFRAPIAGTVQDFSVTLGEYITPGTRLATIANDSAQEITTYVSKNERDQLQVGDIVKIANIYEGTITRIASSIDNQSGKLMVKILTSDTELTAGETVEIQVEENQAENKKDTSLPIRIPLTAILFDSSGSNVLTVSEDNILQAVPVTLGETRGSTVEIIDGIDLEATIVTDVRGKKAGEKVSVTNTQ